MRFLYLLASLSIVFFACDSWAKPSHKGKNPKQPVSKNSETKSYAVPANTITLNAAIEKALANSPRIMASRAARQASHGERKQAGLLPNPELSFEAENIAGKGPYRGADSAELTYGVSQQIEIGGKRSARIGMAEKGAAIAGQSLIATKLDIIRDVTIAYAEAVAAREQVKLAAEQKELSADVLENVKQRVNAAAAPLIQKSKAEVAYSTSLIALDKAEREAEATKRSLASLWGDENIKFDLDSSAFFSISEPLELNNLTEMLKQNPDYTRWDNEIDRKKSALSLEKANAIPDPRINIGVRDFRESGDQALVAGVSFPIPILNSNQGNIAKARHEVTITESEGYAARLQLVNELNGKVQELKNAYRQAVNLKESILPSAQRAFNLSKEGYRAGKFQYLEVLDAQRTMFDAREQHNSTLRDYHVRRAEIERITAKNLNKAATSGEGNEE